MSKKSKNNLINLNNKKRKIENIEFIDLNDDQEDNIIINNNNNNKFKNDEIVYTKYGWGIIKNIRNKRKENNQSYEINYSWGKAYMKDIENNNSPDVIIELFHPFKYKIFITDRELVMLNKGNIINDNLMDFLFMYFYNFLENYIMK